MARIVSTVDTQGTIAATFSPSLPATYASGDVLFSLLSNDTGGTAIALYSTTFTVTIASPAVITYGGTADVFLEGSAIYFTTTGALPTGLSVNTTYYVKNLVAGSNTFEVEASVGGGSINTSGTQSGTHTVYAGAYGWTMVGTQAASQAMRSAWAYRVATSSSETAPTFSGANAAWVGTCFAVRGVDGTTQVEAWQRSDWGNSTNISTADSNTIAASSAAGPAVITHSDDALLIYAWTSDCDSSTHNYMRCTPDSLVALSKTLDGTGDPVAHIIGYRQAGASTTVPSVTMYASKATEGGNGWVLSIKTAAGADLQPTALTTI